MAPIDNSCSNSQARIEKLLRQLVTEHQSGLREDSVISSRAMDSIEDGDETVWSQIGRELEDLGITSNMIKEHRIFITSWIKKALQNGEFEEKGPPAREATSSHSSRRHSQLSDVSSGEHWYDENSRRLSVLSDSRFESARSPIPFPLIPALIQLVECGTKAVVQLNECQSSIRGVPKSLRDITIEIPLLLHTFVQTQKIAEAGHFDKATQLVLLPLVQSCHSQVVLLNETLIKILPRGDDSWRRGLKALFNLREEKKITQIIELLRKYERMMVMKHSSLDKGKDAELAESIDQYEKEMAIDQYEREMAMKHSSSVPDTESKFVRATERKPGKRPSFQTQASNLSKHVGNKDAEIAEAVDQYERNIAPKHFPWVADKKSELVGVRDQSPGERPPFQIQSSNLSDHIESPIRSLFMAELPEFKREQREWPDRKKPEQDTSDLSAPRGGAELNASSRSREPTTLEPYNWYRLTNRLDGYALDVINDGADCKLGAIHMAKVQNVSGQLWQVHPNSNFGLSSLSTHFLGPKRRLDVWGDDKTSPHLADAGLSSGQYWNIELSGSNQFKLTNTYSGPSLFLDTRSATNQLYLSQGDRETQYWTFTLIRPMTALDFVELNNGVQLRWNRIAPLY